MGSFGWGILLWGSISGILHILPVPAAHVSVVMAVVSSVALLLNLLLAATLTYHTGQKVLRMQKNEVLRCGILLAVLFCLLALCLRNGVGNQVLVSLFLSGVLLFGGAFIAGLLSVAVTRTGELLPVVLTAAAADLVSVLNGPTSGFAESLGVFYGSDMQGVPPWIACIIVKAGFPGYSIAVPLFGASDWVLLMLLSLSLHRLGCSDNLLGGRSAGLYFPASLLGLLCSLLCASLFQMFLPAMVFIALFFTGYLFLSLRLHRALQKKDYFYSILFPVIVVAVSMAWR